MPIFEITPQIMREIIMDHYSSPRHKGKPTNESEYISVHTDSVNCIDSFDVYLKYQNDKVVDARWEGVACTISSASTDIMCDRLIGMDAKKGLYLIEQYLLMISEKPFDETVLDEAIVFVNTGKQAARVHCATMGWDAMRELLLKEESHEH